jgi:signal transduction histidine kinase
MLEIAALVIGSLTITLIALVVYAKNRESITNKLFIGLAVGLVGWTIANFRSLHGIDAAHTLFWIRWVMFFVVVQNTSFFLLAQVFPDYKTKLFERRRNKLFLAYSAATALVSLSPYLFIAYSNGAPQPGFGMILFLPHAAISAIGGIINLIRRYRKAIGTQKSQLLYFLLGTVPLFTFVPVNNFVLPVIFKNHFLVIFTPLYIIAFASLIAYAIVSRKLFDIRAAVARSVAYLLVVVTISLIYGIGLFGIVDVIFRGPSHETLRQILSIILITPLALTFQRTKNFLDRTTNRLFFRDAYDSQDVVDHMGKVVSTEIELYKILKQTRDILSATLKTSFVEFILIKNDKVYFEARSSKNIGRGVMTLEKVIEDQRRDVLIVDEMRSLPHLRDELKDNGVAVSLRLKTQQQVIGYILFGNKRSGDMYTQQDKKMLKIVGNQLSVSMQNALRFEEIQNFNLTLQAKVDEATRKMRKNNDKLKALDESKDDFISMASHQLRTPLTSVKGYLSLVLEGDAGKLAPLQQQMLEQAFMSSQRMVYLIADLLNVSRLKTGKFIIESKPVNLATLINEEISQLTESIKSHQLTLEYTQPKDFPEVPLDETKIRQVVMNFADNAIFYTQPGGHVKIELIDKPTTIEFRVVDNGLGVPKDEQPHLFTKFYRAANARKARPDGTGLGLFMAKKVIAAQGGSLIFESTEGKGSTFGFSFNKKLLITHQHIAVVK